MGINIRSLETKIKPLRLRSSALWNYFRLKNSPFQDVSTYCMFIGHARSGHSLISALLDAHPEIVIANELDILWYLRYPINETLLYHLLLKKSQMFAESGSVWTGYSYQVPGQWQGRYRRLIVIGDKKAGLTTWRLSENPNLFKKLQSIIQGPIKIIHVVRNPFDNITTMALRRYQGELSPAVDLFFKLCTTLMEIRNRIPNDSIYDIHSEDFISEPKHTLHRLCNFLGVNSEEEYLNACARIVYKSPSKTRSKLTWPEVLREKVQNGIEKHQFLQGYNFED